MINGEEIKCVCRLCGHKVFPDYEHKGGKHTLVCPICRTQYIGDTMHEAAASWNGEYNNADKTD